MRGTSWEGFPPSAEISRVGISSAAVARPVKPVRWLTFTHLAVAFVVLPTDFPLVVAASRNNVRDNTLP